MMINLSKLKFQNFQKILNSGFTLDCVYLLLLIENGEDVFSVDDVKIKTLRQTLFRKGLINENDKLTLMGKELILFFSENKLDSAEKKKKISKPDIAGFDEWWKAYPGTDTFEHNGKKFEGIRGLRVRKDDCRNLFNKILADGQFTLDEMMEALKYEITKKKEESVKSKTNKLSFMQNSYTYLYQKTYEPFIELIRSGVKIETTTTISGSVDI